MVEAELHDGTILEFPDGTAPDVVQRTVRKHLGIADQPSLMSRAGSALSNFSAPAVPVGASEQARIAGLMDAERAKVADRMQPRLNMPGSVMDRVPVADLPVSAAPESQASPVAPMNAPTYKALESANVSSERAATAPGVFGTALRQIEADRPAKVARIASGKSLVAPTADEMMTRPAAEPSASDPEAGLSDFGKAVKFGFEAAGDSANPIVRGIGQGVAGMGQASAGLGEIFADITGDTGLAESAKAMRQRFKGFEHDAAGQGEARQMADVTQAKNSGARWLEQGVQNASNSITRQIPGLLTGRSGAVLTQMFFDSLGNEYGEAKAKGKGADEALARASVFATFEVLGEKLGLDYMMPRLRQMSKGVATEQLPQFFAGVLKRELPGEIFTHAGQSATDASAIGLRPGMTFEQYLSEVPAVVRDTLIQTGMMTGAGSAMNAGVGRIQAANQDLTAGVQFDPGQIDAAARQALDPANAQMRIAVNPPRAPRAELEAVLNDDRPVEEILSGQTRPDSPGDLSTTEQPGQWPDDSEFADLQKQEESDLVYLRRDAAEKATAEADFARAQAQTEQDIEQSAYVPPPAPRSDLTLDQANALTRAQGFDDPVPTEIQLAMWRAAEKRSAVAGDGTRAAPVKAETAEHVAIAEQQVDTQPTEKQKDAGNYKLGHLKLQGMDIAIENPAGSVRSGVDKAGKPWANTLNHTYGYIKGATAADGDKLDAFIGPNPQSQAVYVIDQVDPDTGRYDEGKVMLGFNSTDEAQAAYLSNYDAGWRGLGAITPMHVDAFKAWIAKGDTHKPLAYKRPEPAAQPAQTPVPPAQPEPVVAAAPNVAAQPAPSLSVERLDETAVAAAPTKKQLEMKARAEARKAANAPTPQPAPVPDAAAQDQGSDRGAVAGLTPTNSLSRTASWVIKNKETGEVVMETFDRKKVDALNTQKYVAVPIAEYLASVGKATPAAQPVATPNKPATVKLESPAPGAVIQPSQQPVAGAASKVGAGGTAAAVANKAIAENDAEIARLEATGESSDAGRAIGLRRKNDSLREAVAGLKNPEASRPNPEAESQAPAPSAAEFSEPVTAAEWANEMQRLRDIKPRPLDKLYGKTGPTPEQADAHAKTMRAWNSDYRKASAAQKVALERDNAEFRAKQEQQQPTPADPVAAAKATLEAAGVTGRERTATIAEVRRGDLTPEDVAEAHPTASEGGKPVATKEPWQMGLLEYGKSKLPKATADKITSDTQVANFSAQHIHEIKAALDRGDDVPLEVLREYRGREWADVAAQGNGNAASLPSEAAKEREAGASDTATAKETDKGVALESRALPAKINPDSLSREVLSKMDKTLKAMGYASRGPDAVREVLKQRIVDGEIPSFMPDWITAYEKAIGSANARTEKLAQKKLEESAATHVDFARVKELGTTGDLREAGYIRANGSLVDLSGKREGGTPGERSYDHREVGDGSKAMQEFMALGNIRMDMRAGTLDISVTPTAEQEKVIRQIAAKHNGELVVDMEDGLGPEGESYYTKPDRKFYQEYPAGTKPDRIIADIRRFFAGETPVALSKSSYNSLEQSAISRAIAQEQETDPEVKRGAGWLKIKLQQAKHNGDLSAKAVEMVEFLVKQNPALVKYLAVAVENPKVMEGGFNQPAYHGSPYKFDKFTLDHIGSGEGAQAYGWGLYFAGRKEVAEWYRDSLVDNRRAEVFEDGVAADFKHSGGDDRDWALASVEYAGSVKQAVAFLKAAHKKDGSRLWLRYADWLNANANRITTKKTGQLYEVEIPEDGEYLLWDKPLSEQPEKVKAALPRVGLQSRGSAYRWKEGLTAGEMYRQIAADFADRYVILERKTVKQGNFDGRSPAFEYQIDTRLGFYDSMKEAKAAFMRKMDPKLASTDDVFSSMHFDRQARNEGLFKVEKVGKQRGDEIASKYLNSLGIAGIKYLDGSSRNQGEGSFNYVIFDENAIKVLQTYYDRTASTIAGNYNPFEQVLTLFRGNASDTTAIHEILHHMERMMPPEMQADIHKEWKAAVESELAKAEKAGDENRVAYFKAVLAGKQKEATELLMGQGADGFNAVSPAPTFKAVDTGSAEFKAWFGDSKVVDAEGKPLVVYHGTASDFAEFNTDEGAHFGTTQAANERAGLFMRGNVMPVYLSIKKPKRVQDQARVKAGEWGDAIAQAKAEGYDGLVYRNDAEDAGSDSYVAFYPEQIKSAISNTGAFDPSNPDIRQSLNTGTDYQYLNPSEFWAVNATKKVEARFNAQSSIWARSLQWLKEALEHFKSALGLRSDHPTIKALDWLIEHGTGERLSGEMLGSSEVYSSFAGERAATSDEYALSTAKERIAAGDDAETVRQETGWFKDADNKWKFEINDSDAKLKKDGISKMTTDIFAGRKNESRSLALGNVLDHPKLFAAYPFMKSYRVTMNLDGETGGTFEGDDEGWGRITLNAKGNHLSTLLHEIQHGIQTREGFATGWSPQGSYAKGMRSRLIQEQIAELERANKYDPENPFSSKDTALSDDEIRRMALRNVDADYGRQAAYRRVAGEVEARNTQARQSMTDAERKATPPSVTADVSAGDVIVVFNGKEMASIPPKRTEIPEETRFRKAQRIGQDKLNRFTVIKEWLAEQGVKLSEAADVYKAEERLHSKFANKAEDFRNKTVEPLVKKIQKAGFTMGDAAQFLHAQHAEERNIQVAKVNPLKPDGGSGMKTAEARRILATAKPELKRLANELRQITETTKQTLLDNGIISQEMADAWGNAYQNYVPLKGGPEEGNATGAGKGLKAVRKLKRALGHEVREEGEWIVENILADHERALMLVEKNRVGQALIRMALEANREDLITIGKPEKRGVLKLGQSTYQVTFHGSIVDAFHNLADAQKFVREEAQKYGRLKSDFGINKVQADPAVAYMASPMLADNEVNVYVAGNAIRVQIHDELLARAYGNMGVEAMNTILKAGRALNTFLSKVYTGYNPEFILTNIVRDFTTGLINISGEEGMAMAGKAMKNYPAMFGQLLRYAVSGKETQWITDYRADGGNTGAAYLTDLERLGKEIQTEYATYKGITANINEGNYMNAARAAGREVFNKTLIWVEHLNQAGENAMRLAIYKAAIESGQSRNKASSLAKNSTVNFNRRGELGQQANALWLFFNAGVQGTAALAHANFKGEHKRQAWALTTAMATLGYLAASALGGGDDDEYDKLSDYTKARNLVIKAGDGWIKIPVPYGYGFFWSVGRTAADAARKGEWGKAPWHLASSFVEEFTPFGSAVAGDKPDSKQLLYALPTAVTLVAAPLANRSGMGGPIMPDSPFDRSKPDRERLWRSTKGTMYDGLAGALTEVGLDVSPETLKHYTRSLTGGAGALVDSTVSAATLKAQGADLEAKETPFVRKFYTETTIADTRRAYYEAKEKAQDAAEEFARAKKARDFSKMNDIAKEKRELIAMDRYADRLSKQIKSQRDRQDAIRVSEMSAGQKRILLKQMENDEAKIYDRYLATFKRTVK